MSERHIGYIPVKQERHLVGVITIGDVLKNCLYDRRGGDTRGLYPWCEISTRGASHEGKHRADGMPDRLRIYCRLLITTAS